MIKCFPITTPHKYKQFKYDFTNNLFTKSINSTQKYNSKHLFSMNATKYLYKTAFISIQKCCSNEKRFNFNETNCDQNITCFV